LASNGSGTNKWGWRWGSKKKKKPSTESLYNAGANTSFAGPALVGAAAGAAIGANIGRVDSSASSVPTLQSVYPVQTDAMNFDARRNSSVPTPQPLITAGPGGVHIQQPQPMHQVPGAIYSTQAQPQPGYAVPSGPPVFSNIPQASYNAQFPSGHVESPHNVNHPPPPRRSNSSPVPSSSWKRDAAIAAGAGALGAAAIAATKSKDRQSISSPTKTTRFELTKEQAKKEERERRRERDREDDDARRRREREQREEQSRREEEERRRDRQRREEDARKYEAERLARVQAEQHERQLERERAERRSRESKEIEERNRRIQDERERRDREARIEALRKEDLEREAEQMRRERREAERRDAEIQLDLERRRREERDSREFYNRTQESRKLEQQQTGSSVASDVRRKEQELQERERDIVHPNTWKDTAATAAVAGAAGMIVSSAIASHRDTAPIVKPIVPSVKPIEPSKIAQDYADEEIFDPDIFKKKSKPSSRTDAKNVREVYEDWEQRYTAKPVSQADFFAPEELRDPNAAPSPKIDPNEGATDIHVFQAHDEFDLGPPRAPPYPPSYSFTATKDGHGLSATWAVPTLNLIQPTPPGSRANSVRGVSVPPSPVIEPKDQPKKEEPKPDEASRRGSKVSWGENQFHNYEVPTPDSTRDQFISDSNLKDLEKRSQDEIVVEHDSPESGKRTTTYRPEREASAVEPEIPSSTQYVPDQDDTNWTGMMSKKSSKKDKKKAKVAAAAIAAAATAKVLASEDKPEKDNKSSRRQSDPFSDEYRTTPSAISSNSSVYQAPFYESTSDIGVKPSQPKGVVEAEFTAEPEEMHIPGAFDDSPIEKPAQAPTEPAEDEWAPITKKGKKGKKASAAFDDEPIEKPSQQPTEPAEDEWASTTKKGKKGKKGKKSQSTDSEIISPEAQRIIEATPAPTITPERVEETPREPERKLSKKEQKKKAKASKRVSLDNWEDSDTSPADTPTVERDIRDIEPVHAYSVPPPPPEPRYEGGVDLQDSKAAGKSSSAAKGALAGGFAALVGQTMKQDQDRMATDLDSARRNLESASTYDVPAEASSTNGTRSYDDAGRVIPSSAFNDVDELADVKTPKRKDKRHSGKWSPSIGSPLREVQYNDYIGPRPDPNMEPTTARDGPTAHMINEAIIAQSGSSKTDPDRSRGQTIHDSGYYAPDDPPHNDYDDRDSDEFFSAGSDDRKKSKGKSRDSDKYDDRDTRSTVSSGSKHDDEDREERRRRRREEREREQRNGSPTRDRNYEDRGNELDDGERKKRHHRRRETDERSDDWDNRSMVSESRSEANGERKRKHKRRDSERNGSPEDKNRSRSYAASEPGDVDDRERKSSRRKSKRDDDDLASVVSSPAGYSEEKSSKKDKEKRSSGLFGIFSKSKENLADTSKSSKSKDDEDDEDRRHRKKKHRDRGSIYGSDDDDSRSTISSSSRREKRRSTKDDYTEEDQSFLGDRAVAATPLPESEAAPATTSRDLTAPQDSGIPGDRPEFPLPTLDNSHSFPTLTPGSRERDDIERPTTPIEDSKALLSRLTGLQPWLLEAFPDELPPLPVSRPTSPRVESPESTRPPHLSERRPSSTSVPIGLRFRRPPASPGAQRDLTLDLKQLSSPVSSPAPTRSRHSKTPSAEFTGGNREYRPLYLLERNRKSAELEEEILPALPSSGSPSRASSEQVTEDEYQSALESPHLSNSGSIDDSFNDAFMTSFSQGPGPEVQHPELQDREIEELPESQQTTPKASSFPAGVMQLPEDSSERQVEKPSEDMKGLGLSLDESAPLDDTKMRDFATSRSRDTSTTRSSSALQDAALGLLVGGATAAALRHRTPSPSGYDSDFMGGELDQETIDAAAAFAPPPAAEPTTPERPTLARAPSSTSKKGKKGRKGSKGKSIDFSAESPKELTAEDRQKIREMDTAAAVEGWLVEPVEEPKSIEEKKSEPPTPIAESAPDPNLLRRDIKGKGKKKSKGKVKKPSISMSSESPASTPTDEQGQPLSSSSASPYVPQFVENEEEWIKNRAESVFTDDATLIGESASPDVSQKQFRGQKVLDATTPGGLDDAEVRYVDVASQPREVQKKQSLQDLLGPALTRKISPREGKSVEHEVQVEPEEEAKPVDLWAATTPKISQETETVVEDEFKAVPVDKKGKNGKKSKRKSQQIEHEPPMVASETSAAKDEDIEEPLRQEAEHDILQTAFADAGEASKYLDTSSTPPSQPSPTQANPETPKDVNAMDFLVGESPPRDTRILAPQESTESPAEQVENTKDLSTESKNEEASRWGSSLFGAFGWGRKKSQAPTSESQSSDAAPATLQEPPPLPPPSVVSQQATEVNEPLPPTSDPKNEQFVASPGLERKQSDVEEPSLPRDEIAKDPSVATLSEGQTESAVPVENEDWAPSSKKKKVKKGKRASLQVSEPSDSVAEQESKSVEDAVKTVPLSPAQEPVDVVEPAPESVLAELPATKALTEPPLIPADEEEWGLPASSKKKEKKGKKARRESMQPSTPIELAPTTLDDSRDLESTEGPDQEVVSAVEDIQHPESVPQIEDDEWAATASKKDKKKKKGKGRKPSEALFEPESKPSSQTAELEDEYPELSKQVSFDAETPSTPGSTLVREAVGAVESTAEDEWATPTSKKDKKKGKKSKFIDPQPNTEESTTSKDDVEQPSALIEDKTLEEVQQPSTPLQASSSFQEPNVTEDKPVDDTQVPLDAVVEDEWALPASKKDKKKKGKKANALEEINNELETSVQTQVTAAETPLEQELTTLAQDQARDDDWPAPVSKKDKKKGKKAKRTSTFDSEPTSSNNERETPLPDDQLAPLPHEPSESALSAHESQPLQELDVVPGIERAIDDQHHDPHPDTLVDVQDQKPDDANEWAPVSKKDKKKAKKGKRASAIESEPATPLETPAEESKELSLNDQPTTLHETHNPPEQTEQSQVQEPEAVDVDEWAPISKKDKKKGKKAKRASAIESEPATPLETPAEESKELLLDEQPATVHETPEPPKQLQDQMPETLEADEWAPISNQDKKKGKKAKRSSIIESEPATPLETPTEESKELLLDEQPTVVHETPGLSQDQEPEALGANEWASISKKDKKKGKKAKRASTIESEPATPFETPAEESKELLLDDQPTTPFETPAEESKELLLDDQPTAVHETPEQSQDQEPEALEADEWAPISKKDKKKAKKGKKTGIPDVEPSKLTTLAEDQVELPSAKASESIPTSKADLGPDMDEPSTSLLESHAEIKLEPEAESPPSAPSAEPEMSPETEQIELPSEVQEAVADDFGFTSGKKSKKDKKGKKRESIVKESEPDPATSSKDVLAEEPLPGFPIEAQDATVDDLDFTISKKSKKAKKDKKRQSITGETIPDVSTNLPEPEPVSFEESLIEPTPDRSAESSAPAQTQLQVAQIPEELREEPAGQPAAPTVQPEEAGEDEWAPPKKKKNNKKSKRESIIEEPAPEPAPIDSIEAVPETAPREVPLENASAPSAQPSVVEAAHDLTIPSDITHDEVESALQPTLSKGNDLAVDVVEQGTLPPTEMQLPGEPTEEDWGLSLSKKDKKKGKKAKRASGTATPQEAVPEVQSTEPTENITRDTAALSFTTPIEPTEPTGPADDEWALPQSKKDKKKGKKAKRASESATPIEENIPEVPTEDVAGSTQSAKAEDSIVQDVLPMDTPEETSAELAEPAADDEWGYPMSKKDKKKAKKSSRPSDTATSISNTLAESQTAADDEPKIEDASPTPARESQEPSIDEWATPLSKKSKKGKGKKSGTSTPLSENVIEFSTEDVRPEQSTEQSPQADALERSILQDEPALTGPDLTREDAEAESNAMDESFDKPTLGRKLSKKEKKAKKKLETLVWDNEPAGKIPEGETSVVVPIVEQTVPHSQEPEKQLSPVVEPTVERDTPLDPQEPIVNATSRELISGASDEQAKETPPDDEWSSLSAPKKSKKGKKGKEQYTSLDWTDDTELKPAELPQETTEITSGLAPVAETKDFVDVSVDTLPVNNSEITSSLKPGEGGPPPQGEPVEPREPAQELEDDSLFAPVSRQSSKKAKKGKKAKDDITSSPFEPVGDSNTSASAQPDPQSEEALSEPTIEGSLETAPNEETPKQEDEDERGGFAVNKSKKDKKRKKNKTNSGSATPIVEKMHEFGTDSAAETSRDLPTSTDDVMRDATPPPAHESESLSLERMTDVSHGQPDAQHLLDVPEHLSTSPVEEAEWALPASSKKKSKKDKKKTKATAFPWEEPTEPTSPTPEVQEGISEEPPAFDPLTTATDTQDIPQDSNFLTPARKLSKKEKRASKAGLSTQDDISRDVPSETEPISMEPQLSRSEELAPTGVSDPQPTVEEPIPADAQPVVAIPPVVSRKLSKKDKKKAKATAFAWDEQAEVNEAAESQPNFVEELRDAPTEFTPSESQVPNTEESIPEAHFTPPGSHVTVETSEQPPIAEEQKIVEEEKPILSRKLSKKDRKKAKQTALWDEPSEPIEEPPRPVDVLENDDLPAPDSQTQDTAAENELPDVIPPASLEEQPQEVFSTPTRKLSKKEQKKKSKASAYAWDEPETTAEPVPTETDRELKEQEPEPSFTEVSTTLQEPNVLPIVPSRDVTTADMHDAPVVPTTVAPIEVQETIKKDPTTVQPADDEPSLTSPLTRKQSKKDKKRKGKATTFDWTEPSPSTELSNEVAEPQPTVEEQPITDDFEPQLSKKDKKKAKKKAAFDDWTVDEPEKADTIEEVKTIDTEVESSTAIEPLPVEMEIETPSDRTLLSEPEPIPTELPKFNEQPLESSQLKAEPEFEFGSKETKKQNLEPKTTGSSWDEPIKDVAMSSPPIEVEQPVVAPEVAPEEPEPRTEEEWGFSSKKNKKDKKKAKVTASADEPVQDVEMATTQDVQEPNVVPELTPLEPAPEAADNWGFSTKRSKKEKRRSKMGDIVAKGPEEIFEPHNFNDAVANPVVEQPSVPSTSSSIVKEQETDKSLEARYAEIPTSKATKKKGKKHKLASMFEPDSPEKSVQPSRADSPKPLPARNLPEAVAPQAVEDRALNRDLAIEPAVEPRAKSPEQDINFTAAVAAGLQESGFDSNLVLNDPAFHRTTSPQGPRDISPEDDVAAARGEASKSRFNTLGRISPTATSPTSQPIVEIQHDVLQTDVLQTEAPTTSFNPMDILNDPTFSQRKSPPGVLEDADHEELWSSSKGQKGKGKKKRGSGVATPAESQERALDPAPIPPADSREVTEPSAELLLDHTQQAIPAEADPEAFWATTSTKKGKKAKKDKKRASLAEDNTERAVETPAIEAPTAVPLAVETPADLATREIREPSLFDPRGVANMIDVDLRNDQHQQPTTIETGNDEWDEQPKKKKDKKNKGKAKRYSTTEHPSEPETPEVVTPLEDSTERNRAVETTMTTDPEQKGWTDDWTLSKKQDKKERKGVSKSEALLAAGAAVVGAMELTKGKDKEDLPQDIREPHSAYVKPTPGSIPIFDQDQTSLRGVEAGEYPLPTEPTLQDSITTKGVQAEVEDEWALSSKKKGKKGKKGKDKTSAKVPGSRDTEEPEMEKLEGSTRERTLEGLGIDKMTPMDVSTTDVMQDMGIHVSQAALPKHEAIHESTERKRSPVESENVSLPGKLGGMYAGLERVKRRVPPVSTPEAQPEEKRVHLEGPLPEMSTVHHEPASQPAAPMPDFSITDRSMVDLEPPQTTTRGHSPTPEPTWSFSGVRDSAVHVADSPVVPTAPQFNNNVRDSGYHDSGYTPTISQGPYEPVEESQVKKKEHSRDSKPRDISASQAIKEYQEAQTRARSPSLPETTGFIPITSPNAIDSATKERTSYLFNSSPSTRGYGESPVVGSSVHSRDIEAFASPTERTRSVKEPKSGSQKKHEEPSIHVTESVRSKDHSTPTRVTKEPYQSIFGDPSEKKSEKSTTLTTPSAKHNRTPSGLDTIKEFSSPDDSPLHKKSRAISDVGQPERGVKSRRSTSPKPIVDRLKSPPPETPTPSRRKHAAPPLDTSGARAHARDSPRQQVHESVDRGMTLSPSRRLPHDQRSPPTTDPTKQCFGEQRSPSALSDRSPGGIQRHKTPDNLRSLSRASDRSATPPLRRVDRSASGDLRAASRLGEVSARDAKSAQPNLSDFALAAGATAVIAAGIASSSKYDPVRDKGKGRVDMPDVYVSFPPRATLFRS
jgi:hypothetical protein